MTNHDRGSVPPNPYPAVSIIGIPLHVLNEENLLSYIQRCILSRAKAIILTLNIHAVNFSVKFPWYADYFKKADLVYCDSDGLRLGMVLLGMEPTAKIPLSRWIWVLCEFCAKHGFRVFLLGGRKGVPEEAARRLKEKFPALEIAGTQDNEFDKEGSANDDVIRKINDSKADVLIVGFGMTLQEKWIHDHYPNLNAHVYMNAGATFEFAAGKIKMAPDWMVRAHLEWLFRLSQEPHRLFSRYVFGVPYFFYRLLRWRFFEKSFRSDAKENDRNGL